MRSFVFGLLCGAIVAAIATAIALEMTFDATASRPPPPPVASVAAVESRIDNPSIKVDILELSRRLDGADDRALAEALDAAAFDRSWARVNAVGAALRARSLSRTDPLTGLSESAVIGPRAKPVPLVALELEVARRRLVLDLRSRDNAATKLLDHASDEEAVRKLIEMFQAEPRPADYERVREDAALVLAFGATEKGREVLARTLHEGPPARAELSARTLGESEDEKAFALLQDLVTGDRDPEVRRLAAHGLGLSSAVAHGSPDAIDALARAARSDAELSVRVPAIAALGDADLARAPLARTVLADVISQPSEPDGLRMEAILSVRHFRDRAKLAPPELVKSLLETIATEHDGPVRRDLAVALGESAPASALPDLESVLSGVKDLEVHEALVRAISQVKARGEPPP